MELEKLHSNYRSFIRLYYIVFERSSSAECCFDNRGHDVYLAFGVDSCRQSPLCYCQATYCADCVVHTLYLHLQKLND